MGRSERSFARTGAGAPWSPADALGLDSGHAVGEDRGKRGVRGYDGAKKVKGRKRHIIVDTEGLLLRVAVQPANLGDREGLKALLSPTAALTRAFPRMKKLWLDQGDLSKKLAAWVAKHLGWEVEVVRRPRKWVRCPPGVEPPPLPAGFQVLRRRWVVERTLAWLNTNRLLAKEFAQNPRVSEAYIYAAMTRLMLRRLVRIKPAQGGHTGDSGESDP